MGRNAHQIRHGHKSEAGASGEYHSWSAMKSRCHNATNPNYPDYGARGITVCDRWREDFAAFLEDMGLKPSARHTIERIDNNQGYRPENCRWATRAEQASNRRSTHLLSFNGETRSMVEWASLKGISIFTLHSRITKYGWTVERALTEPINK